MLAGKGLLCGASLIEKIPLHSAVLPTSFVSLSASHIFWGWLFITSLKGSERIKGNTVNKNLWLGCAAEPAKEE